MFHSGIPVFVFLAALSPALRADLKIQIRETYGVHGTTRTEYFKDRLWRIDQEGGSYSVGDPVNHRSLSVNYSRREYSIITLAQVPEPVNPVSTVVIEIETRDTGEQRQIFGHTARPVVTTEHRRTEYPDRAPVEDRDVVTDGWYLDISGRFPGLSRIGTVTFLTAALRWRSATGPDFTARRSGSAPHGLAIREQTGDRLLEVTDLSEAPLDPSPFGSPPGFRRVIRPYPGEALCWSDRLWLNWRNFVNWAARLV